MIADSDCGRGEAYLCRFDMEMPAPGGTVALTIHNACCGVATTGGAVTLDPLRSWTSLDRSWRSERRVLQIGRSAF